MASQQRDQLFTDADVEGYVDLPADGQNETEGEQMEVFLRRQDGSHTAISSSSTDTVGALKRRVCALGLVPVRAPLKFCLLVQSNTVNSQLRVRCSLSTSLLTPLFVTLSGSRARGYAALVRGERAGGRYGSHRSELHSPPATTCLCPTAL